METTERRKLAHDTADSIINEISNSIWRAAALFGTAKKAFEKLILPELESLGFKPCVALGGSVVNANNYTGEARNLRALLGSNGEEWPEILAKISAEYTKKNLGYLFQPGDYLNISLKVPAVTIDGYDFAAVNLDCEKMVVTAVYSDKVIFNFENIIFHSLMNKENTNKGGFKDSLLAKYLNEHFLKYVFGAAEKYLAPNRDGLKVSLPTMVEVFGEDEDGDYTDVNWGEKKRHPYFEKCTNRIKVSVDDLDDTHWYRLYDPSAAGTSYFARVYNGGYAYGSSANNPDGGVAPVICVS